MLGSFWCDVLYFLLFLKAEIATDAVVVVVVVVVVVALIIFFVVGVSGQASEAYRPA